MHRLIAVLELIAEGKLPPDFKMACMVYNKDIPERVAVDYATRKNASLGQFYIYDALDALE